MRFFTPLAASMRVGAGQLVEGHDGGGLAVQLPANVVELRSQFDARHILQPHHRAVRILAHDDVAEFLLGDQPALGGDRVGEFLALGRGRPADLAGGIDGVLRVDGVDEVVDRDVELGQLVGLDPEAHGVLAGAEHLHVGDAFQPGDLVHQVDVGVVGQEGGVVGAARASRGRPASSGVVGDFSSVTP